MWLFSNDENIFLAMLLFVSRLFSSYEMRERRQSNKQMNGHKQTHHNLFTYISNRTWWNECLLNDNSQPISMLFK